MYIASVNAHEDTQQKTIEKHTLLIVNNKISRFLVWLPQIITIDLLLNHMRAHVNNAKFELELLKILAGNRYNGGYHWVRRDFFFKM